MATHLIGPGQTWATPADIVWGDVAAGDVIDLQGIVFTGTAATFPANSVPKSGTAAAWITIQNGTLDGTGATEDMINLVAANYFRIQNVTFQNVSGTANYGIESNANGDYIEVVNCTFNNCASAAFYCRGDHILVQNCTFTNIGTYALRFYQNVEVFQILNNTFSASSAVVATAISIEGCDDNTAPKLIRGNFIELNQTDATCGDGIILRPDAIPTNTAYVTVDSNILVNSGDGIAFEGCQNCKAYNNTVVITQAVASDSTANVHPCFALGDDFGVAPAGADNNIIKNNAFVSITNTAPFVAQDTTNNVGASNTINNNLYHSAQSGGYVFYWNSDNGQLVKAGYTVAQLIADGTFETGGKYDSVWPLNADYSLKSSSNGIGTGTWLAGVRAYDDLPLPLHPDIGAVQDRTAPGRRFGAGGGTL